MPVLRWVKVAGALLVVVLLIGTGAALTARAVVQGAKAAAFEIRDPNGIDEERFVRIGGEEQWVTIRGRNRDNPVILIVGGLGADGPGTVTSPFLAAFQPWERDFTVVQWDQRGAGKTFVRGGNVLDPELGVALILRDALELTDYLRERLHKPRIILLGVGFGSTIAAQLALDHPQNYAAYVAAGQIADRRIDRQVATHQRLMQLAKSHGDQATLDDLKVAGPHPFVEAPRDPNKLAAFARASGRYHARNPSHQEWDVLTAPHWSLADALSVRAGMNASEVKFGQAWDEDVDYQRMRGSFQIPIAVVQGDLDLDAPLALSRAWLDQVQAPRKVLVVIPGAGTHALQTDPNAFLIVLRDKVRPWVLGTADRRPNTAEMKNKAMAAGAEMMSDTAAAQVHRGLSEPGTGAQ
jgi:pimeloyl-ACP methyl ester carboxylesterase